MNRARIVQLSMALALCTAAACSRYHTLVSEEDPSADYAKKHVVTGDAALIFGDNCSGCHGPDRQGGLGPPLIPSRLDKARGTYEDTIRSGREGTFMPAWGGIIGDRAISSIVDFLLTEPVLSDVTWGEAEIADSHTVLLPKDEWPSEPLHDGNMDNLMLVTEREARAFGVIDGDTHRLLGHVAASFRAHGYAFHPTDKRWVFNLGRDGWLFKVDLYSLQAVSKVRVGIDSRGLAISDDGKYLIAGNYLPNSAVILDAGTLMPLKVIETSGENPDGKFVASRVAIVSDVAPSKVGPYFIIALKDAGQVWRVDWSDPDFSVAKLENVGRTLHDGFLSPDNQHFYVASQDDNWMAVVDVASWQLLDTLSTGKKPHPGSGATWTAGSITYGATVHAAEGKVAIWNLTTNNIVGDIQTAGPGLFLRAHPKSRYVWVDAVSGQPSHEITVFDGQSPGFDVVARLSDGTQTLHPEFTAGAEFVYVSDWKENIVRVYDAHYDAQAQSFPLVATVEGLMTPTGIFCVARRHETLGH